MEAQMKLMKLIVTTLCVVVPGLLSAAPSSNAGYNPHLEHMAVWVKDLDKTAAFLNDALGWRRHPLQFGVDNDSKVFGGMKLGFVDANGIWLELVEPTTPGPGMDFLKEKGNGALVELDFFVDDFDKSVAAVKSKGIAPMGMDGKPMVNGGLLSEWAIKDGKRVRGDERLFYFPMDVSHGTSVEIGWEYPTGVVLLRDATWKDADRTPRTGPHVDHTVVLAADIEKTAQFYSGILGRNRHPMKAGIRRDWMGVGDDGHVWIDGNGKGMWIELVTPSASAAGSAVLKDKRFGDGAIMELGVEVADIAKLYDAMKAKGITMTDANDAPLPTGKKAVTVASSGDSYSYFPSNKSEGMRIMVFQRGPRSTSLFHQRDATAKH
jgi:catechol 2,3-dioxygenase-like lactoylglutathione lyase family enzyme